jgi:hypothetical protein
MSGDIRSIAPVPETRRRSLIRTTCEIVEHLPKLYREIAMALVRSGEIEITDGRPSDGW